MKVYMGNRGIAPLIINLGPSWRWVVNVTPRLLYPQERTVVPIEMEADWVQEQVWTILEKRQSR
jgi:hypothetical protein